MAAAAAGGGLAEWAERSALRRAGRLTAAGPVPGRLRFVFYGRVSTEDWQDPVTSRARQREQAEALVCGRAGPVVQAGDHQDQDPGPYRDVRPDPGAGPLPGRPSAVRVPAR